MISTEPRFKLYERGTPESYRQDARLAMGNKVENAVVELITNSDDSYERLAERGGDKGGRIRIIIDHHRKSPNTITVADRAEGLTDKEMERCFTYPGKDTSGRSSGLNVRGSLGRGAKDVPYFGSAKFECIKDGYYTCLVIDDRGEGDFQRDARGRPSVRCTPEMRGRLGIPNGKNGTVVTLQVKRDFTVKQFKWWCETFRKHFQLRDVLSDPRRRVEVVDGKRGRSQVLRYKYPEGKVVVDKTLEVPDYADAQPRLIIREHVATGRAAHLDDDKFTAYWEAGILVKGGKAIFESTFFDRALTYDPEASRFFGELRCPYIDTLIGEHGKDRNAVVKRDRSGLQLDHPFVEKLYAVAATEVRGVIAARRATESGSVASEETERRLSKLAQAAAKFLVDKAEELEDEFGGGLGGEVGLPPGFYLIPSACTIAPGDAVTLSIVSVGTPLNGLSRPRVSVWPPAGLRHEAGEWREGGEEENRCRLPLRVQASDALGAWAIQVSVDNTQLRAQVHVAPPTLPEPPATLEFEHKSYRVRVGRPRTVRIVAPASEGAGMPVANLASDNPDIVVKGGGVVELRRVSAPPLLEGVAEVVAYRTGVSGTLTAKLGRDYATARVTTDGGGPNVRFDLTDETNGDNRSWWDNMQTERGLIRQLWITVRDKSVKRYLGRPVGGKWPGEDTLHFRMLLAEIIAEEVVREHLLRQSARSNDVVERGVPQLLFEIQKLKGEFLLTAHQHLIRNSEISP